MADARRYWAFLSYSHEDSASAVWLHRALEAYAVPRRLVGRETGSGPAPKRLQPIFRDRVELAADAHLRERVREALEQSAFLIVVCSPAAARSRWVEEEIVRFKVLFGDLRVLAIIVGGSPQASLTAGREADECFPPALLRHVDKTGDLTADRADLIAADMRPGGDGRRLAVLKLVARMLDVGLDDLVRRDAQRRQGRLLLLTGVSMSVALVTIALAIAAILAAHEARAQRNQAEGLVAFMLGDLRKKLEPLGHLDVLDAIGSRAMAYYASQSKGGLDDNALGQRARVLHLLGDIQQNRGNLTAALADFKEAAAATAVLLAKKPDDTSRIFDHAQSVYYVGNVAYDRGQNQQALYYFRQYGELAERLVATEPQKAEWQAEVADADTDVGTILLAQHRAPEALARFRRPLAIRRALAAKTPGERDRSIDLAEAHAWMADAELATGASAAAANDRLAERRIFAIILRASPDDRPVADQLVVNRIALAAIDVGTRQIVQAIGELSRATSEADALMASDRENTQIQGDAVSAYTALGQALLRRGSLAAAGQAARKALNLAEALARRDPTVTEWSGLRLGRARLLAIEVGAETARDDPACRLALAPAEPEAARLQALALTRPRDAPLANVTAEAALLAGDFDALSGRSDAARQAWRKSQQMIAKIVSDEASSGYSRARSLWTQALTRRERSPRHGAVKACPAPPKGRNGGAAGASFVF